MGSGVVIYLQKDAIIENIKEKAMGSITGALAPALPGMVGDSLPDVTGGAVPLEVPKF